ncbi:glycosyltransferase family 2 protein [Hippea jasoniae]|uniref:glycosyltransferase family 2 protein n=1 Tax=Hippea jasoniae TaxID=944479 RepID=UPI0006907851|nr:glycosyltransferase family 2 protein [Hippea jasoniae]
MISIIIPTRNRAYTLEKVLESYYIQKHVDEVIIVDDGSNDNTEEIVETFAKKFPQITTKYLEHKKRRGAAAARITGYKNAKNEYILFGEDDAYLEDNYTEVLLKKIQQDEKIGIVSGRIIYKLPNESNKEALKRFGYGFEKKEPFDVKHFGININAYFRGDIELPLTHALILTKKNLLEKFSYDKFYSKGNGYREESDYQINLFVNGYKIICTNDTHCFHLSREEVKIGGQRVNRFKQLYYDIYYTKYFYGKYYDKAKQLLGLHYSKNIALILFSIEMIKILFPLHKLPKYLKRKLFK